MIRPLAALTRQAQDFFHANLVGLYRWDEVEYEPRQRNQNPAPETWDRNPRTGRRIRPERLEGKYHAQLRLRFGEFLLSIEGPNEHPPIGHIELLSVEGDTVEGPLDPSTWKRIAEHIKQKHEEQENGTASSWG